MISKLKKVKSGFTLIEILIVVALIAILAVVALIALNPAEAQRKARDTSRLKDLGTLQGIIEQYIADNLSTVAAFTALSTSSSGSNSCSVGWVGRDVCKYANTIPVDPANRIVPVTNGTGGGISTLAVYQVMLDSAAQYRICTRFESRANAAKMTTDGGATADFFEIFSATSAPACI